MQIQHLDEPNVRLGEGEGDPRAGQNDQEWNRLFPDDARRSTPAERRQRADAMYAIYSDPVNPKSLREVGEMCGGVSKERVRQIFDANGFETRPALGTKAWHAQQKKAVAESGESSGENQ